MSKLNRRVVLNAPISGVPAASDFRVVEAAIPEPASGELLVRHIYLSLDPYQRSAMSGVHMSADGPLATDAMPSAETVGQVVDSRHPDFSAGDYVRHFGGWQEYSVSDGTQTYRIDPDAAPLSAYLGVLGMPGLTAYASVVKLADVQPGQSVLVSAATGPVGSMVGQIAQQLGAHTYGIAGSDEKCRFAIDELGFAGCANHRRTDYAVALQELLPDGVDVYHDNVGGQMLTDALGVLKNYGTVILCGLISQYNTDRKGEGFNIAPAIIKRAVLRGLVVYDFEDRRDEFFELVAPWVRSGEIAYREDRADGIERAGSHFAKLMSGQNFGKALVVLGPEETG
jgi:NADPH-dependent curcumin reductase CurA